MTASDDNTHSHIDRAYDAIERAVDGIGQVLGVDVGTPVAKPRAIVASRATPIRGQVAAAPQRPTALPPAKRVLCLPAPRVPFRIVETIDGLGHTTFIVTNDVESASCETREFAEQVMASIAAKLSKGTAAP